MRKMMITIGLIIIFFAMLIYGIVTYTKVTKNPNSFEFKPETIYLSMNNITLPKKVNGDTKLDVTNVIVEDKFITVVTENNLDLDVYGVPVSPVHTHEEVSKENQVEEFYKANCYFEIYDQEGNILNDPDLNIIQFKGKQTFAILAKKPESGNKIKIKMFERTTQAFLGETEVKFRY